jgi:hypothetical protein
MVDSNPGRDRSTPDIAIERAVTMQSSHQLIFHANTPDFADHRAPIHAPKELGKKTASLEKLRQADAWKQDNRDLQVMQMAEWFPSIPHCRKDGTVYDDDELSAESTKQKVVKVKEEMVGDSITSTLPASDIGKLATLPGEIRNHIYRYAVLQSDRRPIEINLEPDTCASGACLHTRTGHNVPALAQTCAQLRSEVLSIFIAESAFQFDAGSTRQSCIGNWLRSLGSFADRVPTITFTVNGKPLLPYMYQPSFLFVITVPGKKIHGRVAEMIEMQRQAEKRQFCHRHLENVLKSINAKSTAGEKRTGKLLEEFFDSEELADFVFYMRT